MRCFIFRNQTVEPFFIGEDYTFSGYDDISEIPALADSYIWFYMVPPGEESRVTKEVNEYLGKFEIVLERVDPTKQFIVFTLSSFANTSIVSGDTSLMHSINNFNDGISIIALKHKNVKIVDFNEFARQYTSEQLVNWKFYFISQTLLNPKLAKDFSRWWRKKEDEIALKRKKCLVLDLDNTLWGGILGEDGIDGIKIGGDYPGNSFTCWQQSLLELKKSGVMLAVCSKNNESDVLEAWEKNPFMVLRKDDFVTWRINWHDKASNLKELAEELNIGFDSMVFIDDNPSERELIRTLLPTVEVPEFPDKPYQLIAFYDKLINDNFKVYSVTEEDKAKTEQYKANENRLSQQTKFADYNDYLRSLEIKIDIMPLDEYNLSRIAQMTQKTNQFNLTTRRYTENDIQQLSKEGCIIYCVCVSDKYGDSGITGEIIVRSEGNDVVSIDTFLLSCRILGKGIEFAFLDTILNKLVDKGYKTVKAKYIKSAKNSQVSDFYDRAGFSLINSTDEVRDYSLTISKREIKDYYTIKIQ